MITLKLTETVEKYNRRISVMYYSPNDIEQDDWFHYVHDSNTDVIYIVKDIRDNFKDIIYILGHELLHSALWRINERKAYYELDNIDKPEKKLCY